MNRRKLFGLGLGALSAPVLPALAAVPAFARGGIVMGLDYGSKEIGAELIVEGSINATKIAGGTISADKICISTLRIEDFAQKKLPVSEIGCVHGNTTFFPLVDTDGKVVLDDEVSDPWRAGLAGTQPGEAASEPVCAVSSNEFSDATVVAETTGDRGDLS